MNFKKRYKSHPRRCDLYSNIRGSLSGQIKADTDRHNTDLPFIIVAQTLISHSWKPIIGVGQTGAEAEPKNSCALQELTEWLHETNGLHEQTFSPNETTSIVGSFRPNLRCSDAPSGRT